MSKQTPTSPYAPDLVEVRVWVEQMIAAKRSVDLVVAVITFIGRMRDINAQLVARVAHLTRKRPRSETLERLERQLVLPLEGLVAPGAQSKPKDSELLNVIPAQIYIEQRVDETVACPNDDTIVSASPPAAIVERGELGDTLIVEATCDKYIEHLPIERQCTRFARAGVELKPQTLGRSVNAHIDLLQPIAQLIADRTRAPGYLGTDATGIPVLDPTVPVGIRTGTMWCWTNACWVSFFYAPKGDAQSVRDFLDDDLCRVVQ
ncbi:MAG: transposase [Polyangiaceae bacterium]